MCVCVKPRVLTVKAHTHHGYSVLVAEEHCKRMLQQDSASVSSLLEDHISTLRLPSCLRRPKISSFVLGLVVLFIITASYLLSSERSIFLITSTQFHTIKQTTLLSNLSFVNDSAHIAQVLRRVLSNLDFRPRQLPEMQQLVQSEPRMFAVIPRCFLPDVKNPCWYEQLSGNTSVNPYRRNLYAHYSRQSRHDFRTLAQNFQGNLHRQDGKLYRIRCLPYFYIIGQPKCGTTDLFERLRLHPGIRVSALKEPHWWTRKRFGIIHPSDGLQARYPVEDYLDLFDRPAHDLQYQMRVSRMVGVHRADIIIGEASASTMWDNNAWSYFYGNASDAEPPFLIQDFIHALQPEARFIAILRDPVERLYSDYLYFGMANKSAEDFHEKVWESLLLFDACLQEFSLRACVYNSTLNSAMPVRLHVGVYVLYVLDWLSVVSGDQLLVLRLEDHAADKRASMNRVFNFLQLGPLSEQKEAEITKRPASNTRKLADKNLGPMLPLTRRLLSDFYSPFNRKLARVLKNKAFLWAKDSSHA